MDIVALHARFAAEVRGVDLAAPIDAGTFAAIRAAFERHSFLLFRRQSLPEQAHVDFARRFGELEVHFLKQYLHPEHPELLILSNVVENGKPIGVVDAGQYWHTDTSYWARPAYASLLHGIEIPIADGVALGDTQFVSTTAAYDDLPETTKTRIAGLKAVHRYMQRHRKIVDQGTLRKELTSEQKAAPDAIHPVVLTHPRSGRKCLYVNEGFTVGIVGMDDREAQPLIRELCTQATRPEYLYRHRWQPGDLIMWDNYATQHNAVGDYQPPLRRTMRKATVMGIL